MMSLVWEDRVLLTPCKLLTPGKKNRRGSKTTMLPRRFLHLLRVHIHCHTNVTQGFYYVVQYNFSGHSCEWPEKLASNLKNSCYPSLNTHVTLMFDNFSFYPLVLVQPETPMVFCSFPGFCFPVPQVRAAVV